MLEAVTPITRGQITRLVILTRDGKKYLWKGLGHSDDAILLFEEDGKDMTYFIEEDPDEEVRVINHGPTYYRSN